jgi:hypothetical protein
MTRTIFGSSSPRCASVNADTLWTMGAAARKMALQLGLVHRAGLRLEPGGLQQLTHAGGDDAVKLAGVGGHFTMRCHLSSSVTGTPRALASFPSVVSEGLR